MGWVHKSFTSHFASSDSMEDDDQKLLSDKCSVTCVTSVLICSVPLGPGLYNTMTATNINWPPSWRGLRGRIFTPCGRAVCCVLCLCRLCLSCALRT